MIIFSFSTWLQQMFTFMFNKRCREKKQHVNGVIW